MIDGLRFYVGFARPRPVRFELQELCGLDAAGKVVDTYDLSFCDRMGR